MSHLSQGEKEQDAIQKRARTRHLLLLNPQIGADAVPREPATGPVVAYPLDEVRPDKLAAQTVLRRAVDAQIGSLDKAVAVGRGALQQLQQLLLASKGSAREGAYDGDAQARESAVALGDRGELAAPLVVGQKETGELRVRARVLCGTPLSKENFYLRLEKATERPAVLIQPTAERFELRVCPLVDVVRTILHPDLIRRSE
mmetsp:Transcript_39512/g.115936  ORF Transcript_39512/g.115936 Transcript_39512/m.115936 type:complete len:201 (+) Transcript_39512:62-664(+)